ncbi:hypothetical protein EJB05_15292, partial [Eragrostis curvula]
MRSSCTAGRRSQESAADQFHSCSAALTVSDEHHITACSLRIVRDRIQEIELKMNRRFVNLVTANYKSRMYSLHRLDVSKHLFYPSTAEAEAANQKENNNGGKPPRIEQLRRLPAPSVRLQSYLGDNLWSSLDSFSLLSPDGARILHTNEEGHAVLCDVDSCSTKTMPSLAVPKGWRPISFFAGAGEESLYVMRSVPATSSVNFEVLHLCGGSPKHDNKRQRPHYLRGVSPSLKWQPLPPLPIAENESPRIQSSTLLDDGRVICVSAATYSMSEQQDAACTYCFDTESHEWWRAGDWPLPFDGRAVHVPELDTWLGFCPDGDDPNHLCAVDLSAVAAMAAPRDPPMLTQVWEDFIPPPMEWKSIVLNRRVPGVAHHTTKEWHPMGHNLVNLGSGRFCISKMFDVEEKLSLSYSFDDDSRTVGEFAVLTGVEVDRGGEGGGLRMVKHKSKRYMFTSDCIKWCRGEVEGVRRCSNSIAIRRRPPSLSAALPKIQLARLSEN